MTVKINNLLITSAPGTGKTTLIKNIASRLREKNLQVAGFYTEEIRQAGARVGFKIVCSDGETGILADVQTRGGPKVGKYRVRLEEFEEVGVKALEQAVKQADVIIIDEIGKMELFSHPFREAVKASLDGPKKVIGSLSQAPHPFIEEIKKRPDVQIIRLTLDNRDKLVDEVICLALR